MVRTVPTDDLAPDGARSSVGTVMTKSSHIGLAISNFEKVFPDQMISFKMANQIC